MEPETNFQEQFLRGLFALLALVVPILVGYDIYFQSRVSTLDFTFSHTGLVYEVPFESFADWAGLLPGDVIRTVDDAPFSEWLDHGLLISSDEPYMMAIERDGQSLTLEMPSIPMAKANLLSLSSAVVAALIFWGIGVLLLLRRFQQQEVRLLFPLSQAFAILLLFPLAHPIPLIVPRWAMALSNVGFYLAAPLLLHYYLTFPVTLGTLQQRRRWTSAIYGLALISVVFWLSGHRALGEVSRVYVVLEIIAAVVVLLYVYSRRATPDGRRRLRIVVFGNIAAAGPCILFYILPRMTNSPYRMPEWLVALFLVIAPLSYLYATMRHNLFGIDRLINRTLVYALLSVGILILYLGPFLLIYRFLPGVYWFSPGDLLAQVMVSAGLTLLVGLTFDWSRTRVQRLVDRVFYGGWYDYPGVVETISDVLARSLDREQLTDVLTRQVPELMQLRLGYLWTGGPDETLPVKAPEPYLNFTFTFKGQEHALWIVGPRRDEEVFSAADRRILKTLAHQAEIALSNVLLVETLRRQLDEIRASRETTAQAQRQLLRSREEERARMARDLHDGPIQTLVGLNLHLGLLLAQLEPPPAGKENTPMTEALSAMRVEVKELLTDLRQVCAELRPPMLDTLGLGAALRALTGDWSAQCGVAVHLDLSPDTTLRSLPSEVAVNLYRVVQEALFNVARHAGARRVTVQLTWENSRLILNLCDDGRGFSVPPAFHEMAAHGHFGLVGMQERVNLIGGTWVVESAPGRGTTVRVVWQKNTDIQD